MEPKGQNKSMPMNLTNRKTIVNTLAIGLLAVSAANVQGQDPASDVIVPISVSATAQYQVDIPPPSDTSSVTKHTIKTVKLNLVSLMAANLGKTSADLKGYSLVLMGGAPALYKKATKTTDADSIDVSSMLAIDTSSGTTITSGQEDSTTGASSYTSSTYVTVTFDDGAGNSFTLNGIAKTTSSVSAANNKNGDPLVDKNGDPRPQSESFSISFTGTGYGTVGTDALPAIYSAGSASGSGKGSTAGL
jgi:hypothetical protein